MKKLLSFFLIFAIISSPIAQIVLASGSGGSGTANGNVELSKDGQSLILHCTANYSDSGIQYRTVGWQFTFDIDGKPYSGILPFTPTDTGSGLQKVDFTVPFVGSGDTIQGILLDKYKGTQDANNIANYLSIGGTIRLYAILTVVKNGDPIGGYRKVNGGWERWGNVYMSLGGILKSIAPLEWSTNTQKALETYFKLSHYFPPRPVPPIARIDKNGTIVTSATYLQGETIDLSGTKTWFPDNVQERLYTWKYKLHTATEWKVQVDKVKMGVYPKLPSLPPNTYDLLLIAEYITDTKTLSDSITIPLIIKPDINKSSIGVTASPDPSEVQTDGNQDVNVAVTVKAVLDNYNSAILINNWVVTAQFDGDSASLQTKTLTETAKSVSATFNFKVNKSKLVGQKYVQAFYCTATANLKNKVQDVTKLSGKDYCSTVFCINVPPQPNPAPGNTAPVAVLTMPDTCQAGDDIAVSGAGSHDPDGSITNYTYALSGATGDIGNQPTGSAFYDTPGEYSASLVVTDDKGATGADVKSIVVLPPTPAADIKISGTLKELRKVTFDSSASSSPSHFPINSGLTKWSILPVSGGAVQDSIKYVGTLEGKSTIDVLFKTAGSYSATVTVTNSAGLSDTKTVTFNIIPDTPPVADFSTVNLLYRDTDDSGQATISLNDTSCSPDGDVISQRTWKYRYDSDNDGSFADEAWVVFDSANNTNPVLKVSKVGKYEFNLFASEAFGQDTIPELVSPSDYKAGDTLLKDASGKVVNVDNLPPVTDFDIRKKQKVDILIDIGATGKTITDVQTKVNEILKPSLAGSNIDYDIKIRSTKTDNDIAVPMYYYTVREYVNSAYCKVIYSYNPSTNQSTKVYSISDDCLIENLTLGANGKLYYTTFDTVSLQPQFCEYNPNTNSNSVIDTSNRFYSLCPASDGCIYYSVYLNSGTFIIYKYDPQKARDSNNPMLVGQFYGQNPRIVPDTSGNVYTTSSSGVYRIDPSGNVSYIFSPVEIRDIAYFNGYIYYIGRSTQYNPAISGYDYELYCYDLSNGQTTCPFTSNGGSHLGDFTVTDGTNILYYTNSGLYGTRSASYINEDFGTIDDVYYSYFFNGASQYPLGQLGQKTIIRGVFGNGVHYYNTSDGSTNYPGVPYVAEGMRDAALVMLPAKSAQPVSTSLQGVTWRDGAEHFYINISDNSLPELTDPKQSVSILQSLMSYNTRYVELGTGSNQAQAQSLISKNNNKGLYKSNSDLDAAMNGVRDYINSEMSNISKDIAQFVVMGDDVELHRYYSDTENDTEYSALWKYTHLDPDYYDNSLGIMDNSGAYTVSPMTQFSKVGIIEVTTKSEDNPIDDFRFNVYKKWSLDSLNRLALYVHRRPFARYSVTFTGKDGSGNFLLSVDESSYDLDHTSRADKGIQAKKWQWRLASSATWNDGQLPASLPANNTYLVSLTVQDLEGEWSNPCVKVITTTGIKFPPYVNCNPDYRDWGKNAVSVTVTASDPDGDYSNTKYVWTHSPVQPSTGWSAPDNRSTIPLPPLSDQGVWYLHLLATDTSGLTYYKAGGPYSIDTTKPNISATYDARTDADRVVSHVKQNDASSGLRYAEYRWTDSTAMPAIWSKIDISNSSGTYTYGFDTIQPNDGTWYLHVHAVDYAGNDAYYCSGKYVVNSTPAITGIDMRRVTHRYIGVDPIPGLTSFAFPDTHDYYYVKTPQKPIGYVTAGRIVGIKVAVKGNFDKVVFDFHNSDPEYEKSIKTLDNYGKWFDYYDPITRVPPDLSYYCTVDRNLALTRMYQSYGLDPLKFNNDPHAVSIKGDAIGSSIEDMHERFSTINILDDDYDSAAWPLNAASTCTYEFTTEEMSDKHFGAGYTNYDVRPAADDPQTKIVTFYYLIPYQTRQTLKTWNWIYKHETEDRLNIPSDELLERIKYIDPYELKVRIYNGSTYTDKSIYFDVLETWVNLTGGYAKILNNMTKYKQYVTDLSDWETHLN